MHTVCTLVGSGMQHNTNVQLLYNKVYHHMPTQYCGCTYVSILTHKVNQGMAVVQVIQHMDTHSAIGGLSLGIANYCQVSLLHHDAGYHSGYRSN